MIVALTPRSIAMIFWLLAAVMLIIRNELVAGFLNAT